MTEAGNKEVTEGAPPAAVTATEVSVAAADPADHPEARKTSEWRKALWTMVGGSAVPARLTEEEAQSSWQQLPDCDDAAARAALESAAKCPRLGESTSHPRSSDGSNLVGPVKEEENKDDDDGQMMDKTEAEALETHAAEHWDRFYTHFGDAFFKDRHYLRREFPELFALADTAVPVPDGAEENEKEGTRAQEQPPVEVLEIGCGAGNTAMPLLAASAGCVRPVHVHAFDFSAAAVAVLRARHDFDPARCDAFVADVAEPAQLAAHVAPQSLDFALAIFALSALSVPRIAAALRAVRALMRPGRGRLLLRDYGVGDLSQLRFVAKRGRRLADSFYARGDGTRVYYFSKDALASLAADAGWTVEALRYDTRILRNRKRQLNMRRVWITATLLCPPDGEAPLPPTFVPDIVSGDSGADGDDVETTSTSEATSTTTKNDD